MSVYEFLRTNWQDFAYLVMCVLSHVMWMRSNEHAEDRRYEGKSGFLHDVSSGLFFVLTFYFFLNFLFTPTVDTLIRFIR